MVSKIITVQKQSLAEGKQTVPKQVLKQKCFHEHYCLDRHTGIEDYAITLIDTLKELRRKVLYWMHKLKTYVPYGLNNGDVCKVF